MTDILDALRSGNIDEQAAAAVEAADELTALRERVAALEGALRPFARPLHEDTDGCDDNWPEQRTHKLGDIRHAIAVLSHLLTPESDNEIHR